MEVFSQLLISLGLSVIQISPYHIRSKEIMVFLLKDKLKFVHYCPEELFSKFIKLVPTMTISHENHDIAEQYIVPNMGPAVLDYIVSKAIAEKIAFTRIGNSIQIGKNLVTIYDVSLHLYGYNTQHWSWINYHVESYIHVNFSGQIQPNIAVSDHDFARFYEGAKDDIIYCSAHCIRTTHAVLWNFGRLRMLYNDDAKFRTMIEHLPQSPIATIQTPNGKYLADDWNPNLIVRDGSLSGPMVSQLRSIEPFCLVPTEPLPGALYRFMSAVRDIQGTYNHFTFTYDGQKYTLETAYDRFRIYADGKNYNYIYNIVIRQKVISSIKDIVHFFNYATEQNNKWRLNYAPSLQLNCLKIGALTIYIEGQTFVFNSGDLSSDEWFHYLLSTYQN